MEKSNLELPLSIQNMGDLNNLKKWRDNLLNYNIKIVEEYYFNKNVKENKEINFWFI